MKSSVSNSPATGTVSPSHVPEENPWPMRIGWFAVILLLAIIVSAAIFFSLPEASETQAESNSLPVALVEGLEQGTLLFEQGQLDSAEALYLQLVTDFPAYPQGYNNLAALHALRGELEQARTLLEQAMATDEKYTAIYRNLGTIYAELARDSYGRALQLEPADLRTQLQILDNRGTAQLVAAETTPVTAEPVPVAAPEPTIATTEPAIVPEMEQVAHSEPAAEPLVPAATSVEEMTETQPVTTAIAEETEPAVTAPAVPEEPVAVAMPEPETAEQFLVRWAAAWSSQDAEDYFAFYADDYNPKSHNTKEAWMKKRHSRIVRPAFIEVSLTDFSIISSSDQYAEVELIQNYRNDRFHDKTRKRFELARLEQGWVITRERSLGSVN